MKQLSPEIKKRLKSLIKREAEEIAEHMQLHGWDLRVNVFRSQILTDVFGPIEEYIEAELARLSGTKRRVKRAPTGDWALMFCKPKKSERKARKA